MNNENHTIGIDIGTQNIKIVITDIQSGTNEPRIIHAIESQSHGIRNGYIVDNAKALDSLLYIIKKTEREYKQKITKGRFVLGGIGLESYTLKTSFTIQKKNSTIDESAIQGILQKSEDLFLDKYPNKKILHLIPIKYRVDDKDVLGTPTGMYGSILELKVIFITILEHHYESFINLIEKTGIQIQDIQALPLADAMGALSYRQKTQGCILVNIGSETTALSIFENGILTSLEMLSIGSNDITNDLALGLKIPLQEAERIKRNTKHDYPKRAVDEIIHARIIDILELTGRH
jgi:cell division protein FtsA